MLRQTFLAYVCITSDAERDQNRKSKFAKIDKTKKQKTKSRKSEISKIANSERNFPLKENDRATAIYARILRQRFAALKRR